VELTKHHHGGKKYCSKCRRYFRTGDWRCPYCHSILRDSPWQRKDKQKRFMPELTKMKYLVRRESIEVPSYHIIDYGQAIMSISRNLVVGVFHDYGVDV